MSLQQVAVTQRKIDRNGWPEIKGNPITKVGVFEYDGGTINRNAEPGSKQLDPQKIYKVYRPQEELEDAECIASFRLLPWTNDHPQALLGAKDKGYVSAIDKNIEGVIGEDVYFEFPYLKANLKIFSDELSADVDDGKKDLSIGYRSVYEIKSGEYDGEKFDAIQRKIRGNHLSSVAEGRSGPDIAVLDAFQFTFDKKDIQMPDVEEKMKEETKEGAKDEEGTEIEVKKVEDESPLEEKTETVSLKMVAEKLDKLLEILSAKAKPAMDAEMPAKKVAVCDKEDETKTMDAKSFFAEISKRDALASQLSYYIGTFDHSEKTAREVAEYGIKKLGLSATKGQEEAVLYGYLAGKKSAQITHTTATMDSANKKSAVMDYIKRSN